MKNITHKLLPFMGLLLFSCTPDTIIDENTIDGTNSNSLYSKPSRSISKTWDFNDLNEWTDASLNGKANYSIEKGVLNIFTSPYTWERTKVKTISSFGAGTYRWTVYIPEMGVGDKASIGAFLYYNDTHELDFEIGYGTQSKRSELTAEADDLIAYMTSQGNPFQSNQVKIKRNQWYIFTLELKLNSSGRYIVNWKINTDIVATAQLSYGKSTKFNIFCSVENLPFIGDHIPTNQNYALFDWVEFTGN